MKSATLGRSTSLVEVTNISTHGFWLFIEEQELFVSFKDFPWFKDASIREITNVQRPSTHHLYWPTLDVDLAVESLTNLEKYPLVSKGQPNTRLQSTKTRAAARKKPSKRSRVSR